MRPAGGDAPVLWDGHVAVVAVLVGRRGLLGSGDPGGGPGFLLVDPARRQAGAAALALSGGRGAGGGDGADGGRDAEPGDRQAFSRAWLRYGDGAALRECAARVL